MAKNVLCIDDSKSIRTIIKLYLDGEGYSVTEAVDGLDGLNKIKETSIYDLFLVDVNMPNMDGIAFIKELRKNSKYSKTPVLVLTTENLNDKKSEGQQAGANGWILKPFDPPQFVKVINSLVN